MGKENGLYHRLLQIKDDPLKVKLSYGKVYIWPCNNGCNQNPLECGIKGGLTLDWENGGSNCGVKQERVIVDSL